MRRVTGEELLDFQSYDINNLDPSLFEIVGLQLEENERISTKSYRYWKVVGQILITKKMFIVCLLLLLAIILLIAIVPIGKFANPLPADLPIPNYQQPLTPNATYLFGLGMNGENYWDKIWIGMRTTLLFTLIIALIQILIGVIVGSIWGFYKKFDILFIEITRFLNLVPTLILWLIIIFVLGKTMPVIIFAVSLTSWITLAEVIRVQIILVRNTEYNLASKMLGTSGPKIVTKNIMPRILPLIIQTASFAVPMSIAIDSTLNYFNFGFVQGRENTTLGFILNEVLASSKWQYYPHLLIIPIFFIAGTSVLFFLFGKVFADSLDTKNHYK
ncbi:oligopeptide ABC transporter permease OppC [Spiroplasma endosymbiont of Megaselia nigra]|uniref:oligopeptide ABC transporter permease OppC n=1 Tax=Spiroplasma endosymbiont of Megaselia nigra TaxID=2478537 RepID=UPI000F887D9A|nr:oligopeptide ABC transporter permease OppC [Spiroplasma endosymbiont of Megaselia nigra]RUO86699.1 ABC transporter permease [Spiroplasma endosymbiont of Megaselia nigra]